MQCNQVAQRTQINSNSSTETVPQGTMPDLTDERPRYDGFIDKAHYTHWQQMSNELHIYR